MVIDIITDILVFVLILAMVIAVMIMDMRVKSTRTQKPNNNIETTTDSCKYFIKSPTYVTVPCGKSVIMMPI